MNITKEEIRELELISAELGNYIQNPSILGIDSLVLRSKTKLVRYGIMISQQIRNEFEKCRDESGKPLFVKKLEKDFNDYLNKSNVSDPDGQLFFDKEIQRLKNIEYAMNLCEIENDSLDLVKNYHSFISKYPRDKKYRDLYNIISDYVNGLNEDVLKSIVLHKEISTEISTPNWSGSRTTAFVFAKETGLGVAKWNNCFVFDKKRPPLDSNDKPQNSDTHRLFVNKLRDWVNKYPTH